MTVNGGDSAKIDIPAFTGNIQVYSNPAVPVSKPVNFAGVVALTLTNLATEGATFLFCDSFNAIIQRTPSGVSSLDFRQLVYLGIAFHLDNVTVTSLENNPVPGYQVSEDYEDLMQIAGALNRGGNDYTPNGVNKKLDKSSGNVYSRGSNFHADPASPSLLGVAGATALTFDQIFSDGNGGFNVQSAAITDVVTTDIEDGGAGTLSAMSGPNRAMIMHVYMDPSGQTILMPGQLEYTNITDAVAAAGTEEFNEPFIVSGFFIFRYRLIVRRDAADFTLTADAVFQEVTSGALGRSGGVGGEVNQLVNVGLSGISLVEPKTGVNLNIKSIEGSVGGGIAAVEDAPNNSVEFQAAGGATDGQKLVHDGGTANSLVLVDDISTFYLYLQGPVAASDFNPVWEAKDFGTVVEVVAGTNTAPTGSNASFNLQRTTLTGGDPAVYDAVVASDTNLTVTDGNERGNVVSGGSLSNIDFSPGHRFRATSVLVGTTTPIGTTMIAIKYRKRVTL